MDFIDDILNWFASIFAPKTKKKESAYRPPEFPKEPYSIREAPDLYNIPETLATYAAKWFVSGGMSLEGAAALIGNLWRESYLNPAQLQIINGKPKGPGRGLAQWTDSALTKDKSDDGRQRWDEYTDKFFPMLKSSNPYWSKYKITDAEPQFAFILHEIKNDLPGVWNTLKSPGSISQKSNVVLKKYEVARDRDKPEEQNLRASLSEKVYDIIKKDKNLKNPKSLRKDV